MTRRVSERSSSLRMAVEARIGGWVRWWSGGSGVGDGCVRVKGLWRRRWEGGGSMLASRLKASASASLMGASSGARGGTEEDGAGEGGAGGSGGCRRSEIRDRHGDREGGARDVNREAPRALGRRIVNFQLNQPLRIGSVRNLLDS